MAPYGIGGTLRQERLRQGLTVEDVASQTKISHRFLEAIEAEQFDLLPGLVFARNFVRQYANVLHVDPDPLLAELPRPQEVMVPLPQDSSEISANSWDPRWNSMISSVIWVALGLGAGIAAYIHFNRPLEPKHDVVASQPVGRDMPSAPQPAASGSTPSQVQPAPAQPTNKEPNIPTPATDKRVKTSTHPVQVTLTAREPAWVSVTADGKQAFEGTLQPNDSKEISADEAVQVLAGNAGGLKVSLNGKELNLGERGQVRLVKLTAEGPRFLSRNPIRPPDPL